MLFMYKYDCDYRNLFSITNYLFIAMGNFLSYLFCKSSKIKPVENSPLPHRVEHVSDWRQLKDMKTSFKIKIENLPRSKRCKVLIINNADYQSSKGADVDVRNLSNLFKAIQSSVTIRNNLTSEQMMECIEAFAKNPHLDKVDICFFAILGNIKATVDNAIVQISGNDGYVPIAKITKPFDVSQSPALKGKPKLFLFQGPVCGGPEVAPDDSHSIRNVHYKDIFIANALLLGKLRTREIGSYYIQALCKVFMRYASKMDFQLMMNMVDEIVYQHDKTTQHTHYQSLRFDPKCYFNSNCK